MMNHGKPTSGKEWLVLHCSGARKQWQQYKRHWKGDYHQCCLHLSVGLNKIDPIFIKSLSSLCSPGVSYLDEEHSLNFTPSLTLLLSMHFFRESSLKPLD